jgi:hypothetical protein
MKKKSASWAVRELKAAEELYQFGDCTPELYDALRKKVFQQLEAENAVTGNQDQECSTKKTPKTGKCQKRSRNT